MQGQAEGRRKAYLAALVAFAAFSALRLWRQIANGDDNGLTFTIALVLVVVIVVVVLAVMVRRVTGLAGKVAAARPGAHVIPALTAGEMVDIALALGVSHRGLGAQGGQPVALALLPDRIEVWARKDDAPRWWIPRDAIQGIEIASAVFGGRRRDAVWVRATTGALVVQPAYRPLRSQGGAARADLERCVQELGGKAFAAPTA